MRYFPIFLDVDARKVLVVGGGETAAQKVRLLLKSSAFVTVIAEDVCAELRGYAFDGRLTLHERAFSSTNLDETAVLFVATNDAKADASISQAARDRNIPVNVVDTPDCSSFITPAIVDRDPLIVAIGTEGAAPILAQGVKSRLEAILPQGLGGLVQKARQLRSQTGGRLGAGGARRAFWSSFFFGAIRDAYLAGNDDEFEHRVAHATTAARSSVAGFGRVSFVGAGAGDTELLTLKAQRLLQSADVIVHDNCIGSDVLEYARRDATRVSLDAEDDTASHDALVSHSLRGNSVLRLLYGDPSRNTTQLDESKALAALGIPVDVVPGVSAPRALDPVVHPRTSQILELVR